MKVPTERKAGKVSELRDGSVDGNGLHPDAVGKSWDEIRDLIYEGHGGSPPSTSIVAGDFQL
jgi:hypothetical protein